MCDFSITVKILLSRKLNGEKNAFYQKFGIQVSGENGTVLLANEKQGLFIKAKNGILSILEIQGENAKRMTISDFLRGNKIEAGQKFE